MTVPLAARVDKTGDRLVLRITNVSPAEVAVLDPALGRPPESLHWPRSTEVYRASLLMSYGYLSVTVTDEAGNRVDPERVESWATPVLKPPVSLAPGGSMDVPVPLAPFYTLRPGRYRVSVEYGDAATTTMRAEGSFVVQDTDPIANAG